MNLSLLKDRDSNDYYYIFLKFIKKVILNQFDAFLEKKKNF